ncbi:MAG: heme biosynthesis HemY N-terminal domain-containing protein [Alphaproteobacteria bacterium]
MRRTLWLFVKIAVVVAIAVWVVRRPGTISVDWLGWRIETSVGVALLALVVLLAVVAGGYATWRALRRSPGAMMRARRDRRRAAGYRALTEGLVAVAAGNPDEAKRHARKADGLLNEPPLTLLLSAQAAQLSGDTEAAKRDFEAMLERPETEFLGLRGLIVQALKDGDRDGALALARRAYALRPSTPWVLETLIDLHGNSGDWRETQKYLTEARRGHVVAAGDAGVKEAALLTERARASHAAGHDDEAYEQARRAHELDPALAPAAAILAEGIAAAGRIRRARKIVEAAWKAGPHPMLVPVYLGIVSAGNALDRYSAVRDLVEEVPDHAESRFALAEAAADAGLWGEACHQIDALTDARCSARAWHLRARIAGEDNGDDSDPAEWLQRAEAAAPDPAWVCRQCGTLSDDWMGVCGNCGALAGVVWMPPPRMHRLALGSDLAAPGETEVGGKGAGETAVTDTPPVLDASESGDTADATPTGPGSAAQNDTKSATGTAPGPR